MSRSSSYTLEKVQLKPGFTSAAILDSKTKTPARLVMKGKFTSDLYDDDYYKGDGKRAVVYYKPDAASVTELRKMFAVVSSDKELKTLGWTLKPFFSKDETVRLKLKFESAWSGDDVWVPKGFVSTDEESIQHPKGLAAEIGIAVSTYYNDENKTAGLFFTVNEIIF